MVERVRIFKDKYENNCTAMSIVHKHLQTTPEVGITHFHKEGHTKVLIALRPAIFHVVITQ